MDNFKFGIFDIFSAMIPGIPLTIFFSFLLNKIPFSFSTLIFSIQDFNITTVIILLITSYILGFSSQYISYETFKFILKKTTIWDKRIGNYPISLGKRGRELSEMRQFSKENFNILNTFIALRAMSYNLSFTMSISTLGILLLNFSFGKVQCEIIFISVILLFLSVILFRRAVSFHEWSHQLISESKKTIKKVKKLIQNQ